LEKRKNRREILEDQLLGLSLVTKNSSHLRDFKPTDFSPENQEAFQLLLKEGSISPKQVEGSNPLLATRLELLMFASSEQGNANMHEPRQDQWKPDGELLRVKAELKITIIKARMQQIPVEMKNAKSTGNKALEETLSKEFTEKSQELLKYQNN
jgi:hypothetical protein